jgi:hypothetical protein
MYSFDSSALSCRAFGLRFLSHHCAPRREASSGVLPNAQAVCLPWLRKGCLSIVDAQERELVIATVSGSTTPVEIWKIAQIASMYKWQ